MTNNDVLRRLSYILELDAEQVSRIIQLTERPTTAAQVAPWLKDNDEADYQACTHVEMASFLNGLIIDKRGPKDGPQPAPEKQLNNNIIFRKLKIAFDLQADEVLAMLALSEMQLSKHELSALFRKPEHKHYRQCKDEVLSAFLLGLQLQQRNKTKSSVWPQS